MTDTASERTGGRTIGTNEIGQTFSGLAQKGNRGKGPMVENSCLTGENLGFRRPRRLLKRSCRVLEREREEDMAQVIQPRIPEDKPQAQPRNSTTPSTTKIRGLGPYI